MSANTRWGVFGACHCVRHGQGGTPLRSAPCCWTPRRRSARQRNTHALLFDAKASVLLLNKVNKRDRVCPSLPMMQQGLEFPDPATWYCVLLLIQPPGTARGKKKHCAHPPSVAGCRPVPAQSDGLWIHTIFCRVRAYLAAGEHARTHARTRTCTCTRTRTRVACSNPTTSWCPPSPPVWGPASAVSCGSLRLEPRHHDERHDNGRTALMAHGVLSTGPYDGQ